MAKAVEISKQTVVDETAKYLKATRPWNDVSCYGHVFATADKDKVNIVRHDNGACHAGMSTPGGAKYIIDPKTGDYKRGPDGNLILNIVGGLIGTYTHCQYMPKDAGATRKLWYDWMVDPEISPWNDLISTQDIMKTSDGTDIYTGEFLREAGIIISNLDVPSNFLLHMFITSRIPKEDAERVARWVKLVDKGVHPSLAYVGSGMTGGAWGMLNSHCNTAINSLDWVEHFVRGRTHNLTDLYSKNHKYHPVNEVYGRDVAQNYWGDKTRPLATDKFDVYMRDTYKYGINPAFDVFADALKQEQARMGLADWNPAQRNPRGRRVQAPAAVEQDAFAEFGIDR